MRIHQLVRAYEKGAITGRHLVVEALLLVDPASIDGVMEALPPHLHQEVKEFVERYRPGEMHTNYGPIPSPESVRQVKHWLDRHLMKNTASR
jgi:hypothetical protein